MTATPRSGMAIWLAVVALLAAHAWLALSAVRTKSIAVDEIFHVTGGYFYNRFGDFRIHPDNGVLPQRWQALPAWLGGARPPDLTDNELWRTSSLHGLSHQFFYHSGNDHWPILMGARTMSLAFSLATGLLVFGWARRLAGPTAGLTALGLWAFSPTFLAHGPLATSDVCAGLLLPASAGAFWWQLRAGDGRRTALSALTFGLACLAKHSAVLLLPTFAGLLALHWLLPGPAGRRPGRDLASLALHGAAALLLIWAAFDFRYSAFAPGVPAGHFIRPWDWMTGQLGAGPARVITLCRDAHLLPESYLFGLAHTLVSAQERIAFLAGDYRTTGWVQFFPLAFLWKSTGAELGAGALALLAATWPGRTLRPWLERLAPLLMWGLVYGAAAVSSHLNIGHRHLVPLYPALFIVGGLAAARLRPGERMRRATALTLVAFQAAAAVAAYPHYLAFFNRLAGGPENGRYLLVDSSLDWGQDLPGLAQWLDEHNRGRTAGRVYLAYFGSGRPDYYGIRAATLPRVDGLNLIHPWAETGPGLYCISATMLQGVYSPVGHTHTPALEREYQALRELGPLFRDYWLNPESRAHALRQLSEPELLKLWVRYDWIRFTRLCAYLRVRAPDADIGHSLLIYRLSADEIDRVLNQRYSDWLRAIEQARDSR